MLKMMSDFKSQALSAKVRARFGKRLTQNQYDELLHKKSVSEVAAWLKGQPIYSGLLHDVQESTIHRGQLEQILKRNVFLQYLQLLRFDFAGENSYFNYRIRSIEIDQILQMIQAINSNDIKDYLAQVPNFASAHLSFDLVSISKAKDFDSLLSLLPKSPYEHILAPLRPIKGEKINYIACEKALYSNYYSELYKVLNACFTGKTRKELTEVLSTWAQLMNLESIYRLKKFYNLPPNKIQEYLLPMEAVNPTGDTRQSKLFYRMLEAQTPEELIKEFTASTYGKYAKEGEGGSRVEGDVIEYAGACIKYRFSVKNLFFSSSAPVIFTAYLTLLEIETQNLITIIEGLRYGLPSDEIHKMLVLS